MPKLISVGSSADGCEYCCGCGCFSGAASFLFSYPLELLLVSEFFLLFFFFFELSECIISISFTVLTYA